MRTFSDAVIWRSSRQEYLGGITIFDIDEVSDLQPTKTDSDHIIIWLAFQTTVDAGTSKMGRIGSRDNFRNKRV